MLSSFATSAPPGFLLPRKMGTKEPDSLFFGITNPDFFENKETFGLTVDDTDEVVVMEV